MTFERGRVRDVKRQERDRSTWPGLDKVTFSNEANFEYSEGTADACFEPLRYGTNILKSSTFTYGLGPNGNEIPFAGTNGTLEKYYAYYSDDSKVFYPNWVQPGAPGQSLYFYVEPAGNARMDFAGSTGNSSGFWLQNSYWCEPQTFIGWGFRIGPGDKCIMGVRARVNVTAAGFAAPTIRATYSPKDRPGNTLAANTTFLSETDLNSAYTLHQGTFLGLNDIYRSNIIVRFDPNGATGSFFVESIFVALYKFGTF